MDSSKVHKLEGIYAGKEYRLKRTTAHDRKAHSPSSAEQFVWGGIYILSARREDSYIARSSFFPSRISCTLGNTIMMKRLVSLGELRYPLSNSLGNGSTGKMPNINFKRRLRARTECFISSDPTNNSWIQQGKLNNIGRYRLAIRTRADFKSEQYEITGPQPESFSSSEASSEAVLPGGNVRDVSRWWEQFPKRWLIVLLCFFAFLLCNMDRVSLLLYTIHLLTIPVVVTSKEDPFGSLLCRLPRSLIVSSFLFLKLVKCGAGKYEHCNPSNVGRV